MAGIQVFVKVDGRDGDALISTDIRPAMQLFAQRLTDAGHQATVKVAIVCEGCGGLLNPGLGNLCDSCALAEAEDSMEQVATSPSRRLSPVPVF